MQADREQLYLRASILPQPVSRQESILGNKDFFLISKVKLFRHYLFCFHSNSTTTPSKSTARSDVRPARTQSSKGHPSHICLDSQDRRALVLVALQFIKDRVSLLVRLYILDPAMPLMWCLRQGNGSLPPLLVVCAQRTGCGG